MSWDCWRRNQRKHKRSRDSVASGATKGRDQVSPLLPGPQEFSTRRLNRGNGFGWEPKYSCPIEITILKNRGYQLKTTSKRQSFAFPSFNSQSDFVIYQKKKKEFDFVYDWAAIPMGNACCHKGDSQIFDGKRTKTEPTTDGQLIPDVFSYSPMRMEDLFLLMSSPEEELNLLRTFKALTIDLLSALTKTIKSSANIR